VATAPRSRLQGTFQALRAILAPHAKALLVNVDTETDYQLCSRTLKDRVGRPLFVAAVQTKKNYVSYHLMPIYADPRLQKSLSPALKKRMQGKSCFNFTSLDELLAAELAALTRRGIAAFRNVRLPWAPSVAPLSARPRGTAARPQPARARR
jgi:hypothetical protein